MSAKMLSPLTPCRPLAKCLRGSLLLTCLLGLISGVAAGEDKLPVQWEDLTAPQFVSAIQQAQGVCILPFGILEKHGPHLPIGADLINIRYVSLHSAEQNYAVVFPAYYFGEIFEAKQEPGAVAYSASLQMQLLQETTKEMARNGCKKIIIANGHGGNSYLLPYFAQAQLASPRDYVVYAFQYFPDSLPRSTPGRPALHHQHDGHAGEEETSLILVSRPDLKVDLNEAKTENWEALHRLHLPPTFMTGISWYANFPNHYAGDGSSATKALGEFDMKTWIGKLVEAIKAVKADDESLKLQNEFYEQIDHPLDTKQ